MGLTGAVGFKVFVGLGGQLGLGGPVGLVGNGGVGLYVVVDE